MLRHVGRVKFFLNLLGVMLIYFIMLTMMLMHFVSI